MAAAAIVALIAGCGSAPAATPTPSPTGPLLLHIGQLAAGDYTTSDFVPQLTFTLPDGWKAYFPDDADEIALGGPKGDLNITRPTRVLDPGVTDAPEDIAAWLLANPRLDAGDPTTVTVAGIEGSAFDVAAPSVETDLFFYPTGSMHIPAGQPAHFIVLPMEGADMVFVTLPVGGTLAEAIASTTSVIDSLEIVD